MRPLEIPYNFDMTLIDNLQLLDKSGEIYDSIYCCPYKDDYIAAKRNHPALSGLDMWKSNDMERNEYIKHIRYIHKHYPDKLMLLLQQNGNITMPIETLRFYLGLGFRKFCVGNLTQAKQLKEINPNFYVIGSITMKATPQQLNDPEFTQYLDGVVLFFPYNRNLALIKTLPKELDYILLVNCDCNIHCEGTHHWFASRESEIIKSNFSCPNGFFVNAAPDWEHIIRIRPMDTPIFDPYIKAYKLQGREYETGNIIRDIVLWTTNYERYPGIQYSEDIYQTLPAPTVEK